MKEFYAYIRVSTVRQGEKGSSLQEQRDAIAIYAQRNNLKISEWFEERETAAKLGRRVFNRMLLGLERGKARGVILHKIDRGARNLWDWASLQNLLDRGVEVHLAHETLDLNSRGGRLAADLQAVIAADYVRNLKDEVRKGFNGRLKQGLYPLPAPLGYIDKGRGKPKEPDPVTAPLVRKAFELYATGRFSLDTLGDELCRLGLRNQHGKKIHINSLAKLLHNPFYIGVIHIKRTGQTFSGIHEPLIAKSLFDRVEAVLTAKSNTRTQQHDFVFRRMLRCFHCGRSLTGEIQKGHVYYRCHSRECPPTCVKEEKIDARLRKVFSAMRFDENELGELLERAQHLKDNWLANQASLADALKLNLDQVEERLSRLTDAYIDRAIDRDTFEARKAALIAKRLDFRERLNVIRIGASSVPEKVAKFFELSQSALLSYETGFPDDKREILKSVTSNLQVERQNVVVKLQNPFQAVASRAKTTAGGPQRDRLRTDDWRLEHFFKIITDHLKAEPTIAHDA